MCIFFTITFSSKNYQFLYKKQVCDIHVICVTFSKLYLSKSAHVDLSTFSSCDFAMLKCSIKTLDVKENNTRLCKMIYFVLF